MLKNLSNLALCVLLSFAFTWQGRPTLAKPQSKGFSLQLWVLGGISRQFSAHDPEKAKSFAMKKAD